VRASLSDYLDKFDATKFMRVHQRYAINIDKVDKIHPKHLIVNNEEIPVSKSYSDQLFASLKMKGLDV
jgi:DNA-binding LytR/AlgR family response regulator